MVLPEAIVPVVSEMGSAPFVLMGFNLWTAEFKDAACGKIQGVISGDNSAQDAVDTMWSVEQEYYKKMISMCCSSVRLSRSGRSRRTQSI